MQAQPEASHFVDGTWLEDSTGEPIEVIYPGSGAVIAVVHEATPAVIEAALAAGAWAQTAWGALRPVQRGRILHRAADLIRAQGPALAMSNAMVLKPSDLTPLGALQLARIYIEAGLPAGLFNVV